VKKICAFLIFFLLLTMLAAAQGTGYGSGYGYYTDYGPNAQYTSDAGNPGASIFAPFVTNLEARVQDRLINLSWRDSGSVLGWVYIYRSRQPFSNGIASAQGEPKKIPHGLQAFAEQVDSLGPWYYWVVASDENDQRYELAVNYCNMVDINVDGSTRIVKAGISAAGNGNPASNVSPARTLPFVPRPSQMALESATWNTLWPGITNPNYSGNSGSAAGAEIHNISAEVIGNAINITFAVSNRYKNPVLYRSLTPIRTKSDLRDMSTVAVVKVGVMSPFLDTPEFGVSYYYTVVFEEDISSPYEAVWPGNNATISPAALPPRNTGSTNAYNFPSAAAPQSANSYSNYGNTATPPATTGTSGTAAANAYGYNTPLYGKNGIMNAGNSATLPANSNQTYVPPASSPTYPPLTPSPITTNRPAEAPSVPLQYSNTQAAQTQGNLLPTPVTTTQQFINGVQTTTVPMGNTAPAPMNPSVFAQDLQSQTAAGEDYDLAIIVQNSFRWRDWARARTELQRFLNLRKGGTAEPRAHFYLGQVYYFMGAYGEAMNEFVYIQGRYPDRANSWIQACSARIAETR
jgi:hypothetical protein